MLPVTYGNVDLTLEQVEKLTWKESWDFLLHMRHWYRSEQFNDFIAKLVTDVCCHGESLAIKFKGSGCTFKGNNSDMENFYSSH